MAGPRGPKIDLVVEGIGDPESLFLSVRCDSAAWAVREPAGAIALDRSVFNDMPLDRLGGRASGLFVTSRLPQDEGVRWRRIAPLACDCPRRVAAMRPGLVPETAAEAVLASNRRNCRQETRDG